MQSISSRFIYTMYKIVGSPFAASAPLSQQRAAMERISKILIMPSKVDVQPLSIGEMYAEWIRSPLSRDDCAILYLHGGGYTMGSCHTHRTLAARISLAAQAPALLIEYRLAPEHPFPAALDDAAMAYHYLVDQGIEPRRIILAGDSAGGGLALALALFLRDANEPLPGGLVCLSPWADLTLSGETVATCAQTDPIIGLETSLLHAARYVGQQDLASPLISPVFADLSRLPPLFIQVGEHEILRSDSVRLVDKAQQAGVDASLEIWPGMWHLWHLSAGYMPESQRAIDKIGAFVRRRLDETRPPASAL